MAKGYEGKETEFNGAMLQALRLDQELQTTNQFLSTYHQNYEPENLRRILSHVYNLDDEIYPKMTKKERTDRKTYIEKINEIKGITKKRVQEDGEYTIDVNTTRYEKKIHRIRAFRRFLIQCGDRAQMFNPNKKTGPGGARGF